LFGLHSDDADLKHLYKLIGELEENPPKGDVSFMQVSALTSRCSCASGRGHRLLHSPVPRLQWLVDHGLPYRMLGVADALYAKVMTPFSLPY
jgi:hypothetical protein